MEYTIIFDDLAFFFFLLSFDFHATCGCWSELPPSPPPSTKRWISDRKMGGASNSRRNKCAHICGPFHPVQRQYFIKCNYRLCSEEVTHNNHSNGFITAFRLNEIHVIFEMKRTWNVRMNACAIAHYPFMMNARNDHASILYYEFNSIQNRCESNSVCTHFWIYTEMEGVDKAGWTERRWSHLWDSFIWTHDSALGNGLVIAWMTRNSFDTYCFFSSLSVTACQRRTHIA